MNVKHIFFSRRSVLVIPFLCLIFVALHAQTVPCKDTVILSPVLVQDGYFKTVSYTPKPLDRNRLPFPLAEKIPDDQS